MIELDANLQERKFKIKIHTKHDDLLNPRDLKEHPRNRNKHTQDQIERLAKLFEHHGIRHPIIISKRSGFIVAGHARRLTAIRLGMTSFPVVYQDFENNEAEYQFLIADNAIAEWATLDFQEIHMDLSDLGPFDLELLGMKEFTLDFPDESLEKETKEDKTETEKLCPNCGIRI